MSCNIGKCQRKDCIYRAKQLGSCDYILLTGHRRGCSVEECTKYITQKQTKPKKYRNYRKRGARNRRGDQEWKIFGENLRAAIFRKFPSEASFSRAIGMPQTSISSYCRGKGRPRAERIKEICEMLETSESELFREVKENVCN